MSIPVKHGTPERSCAGCGTPITQPHFGRRKWCSEKCRKRTLYSGVCVDCGGRTDGLASGFDREPERCRSCNNRHLTEGVQAAAKARREDIAAMWAEGLSLQELAAQLGVKANVIGPAIVRLRREGVPLPYRKPASAAGRRRQVASGRAQAKRLARERRAT